MVEKFNKFYKRKNYGDVGEGRVVNILTNLNIKFRHLTVNTTFGDLGHQDNVDENARLGDIHLIDTDEYIDIKYTTFIAIKSAYAFDGDFFVLIPYGDITKSWVVRSETVRAYFNMIPKEKLQKAYNSDSLGHYFKNGLVKSQTFMSFLKERMN